MNIIWHARGQRQVTQHVFRIDVYVVASVDRLVAIQSIRVEIYLSHFTADKAQFVH
jgi:hypothetical protein